MNRRIKLPSGKILEVIYRKNEVKEIKTVGGDQPLNLHVCPECKKENVLPYQWEEHDEEHWDIHLRCPDCESLQHVIAPDFDCNLFDDVLERNTDILTRDYKRLLTANMAEEIERFSRALETELILPEDF